ncbi:Fe-S oxidoreductase [Desulfonatronum zhilinae]|nr:Fe-S oxidoreductase [Desulfonatronum zhilinae]
MLENTLKMKPPEAARHINEACTRCGTCVRRCAFLTRYGMPGDIARRVLAGERTVDPFECSLCNLCSAVCPEELAPGHLFLAQRRLAVDQGLVDFKPYAPLLGYEKRGHSSLFAWYPPSPAKTIFFPGCTLPGTRPRVTWRFFETLRELEPKMAMVLDCCHKPSHDLGRQSYFFEQFRSIRDRLQAFGVERIIVACPNCHKVFKKYGEGLTVTTVYEVMAQKQARMTKESATVSLSTTAQVTVHDPCPLRDQPGVHQAVRSLLAARGFDIREMEDSGTRTLCCGEGGAVGFRNPALAAAWVEKRRTQAQGDRIITYCAGCVGFLNRAAPTSHLGDVLFEPEKAMRGRSQAAKAPLTYWNRLWLKRKLIRSV